MYAPLQFCEQVENMVQCSPDVGFGRDAASIAKKYNEELLTKFRAVFSDEVTEQAFFSMFILDFEKLHAKGKFPKNEFYDYWRNLRKDVNALGLSSGLYQVDVSDYDFFTQLMQFYLYETWRYSKIGYRVGGNFGVQLANMEFPKNALLKCFTKLPAQTFYIDLSDCEIIIEGLEGMFISTKIVESQLLIEFMSLVRLNNGRLQPIFAQSHINLGYDSNDDDPIEFSAKDFDDTAYPVRMEDETLRHLNERELHKFVANFLVYFSAINRDIEEAPECKKAFAKKVSKGGNPKNKFSELRLHNVGYKLSTPLPSKKSNSANTDKEPKGSPKSPHYRSAHYHSYWVGSGDDKKLIVKWVEGVFVNGKAVAKEVILHEIK